MHFSFPYINSIFRIIKIPAISMRASSISGLALNLQITSVTKEEEDDEEEYSNSLKTTSSNIPVAEANVATVLHFIRYRYSSSRSASIDEIKKEFKHIDLHRDLETLSLLKKHSKIKTFFNEKGILSFKYKEKYTIQGVEELLNTLEHEYGGYYGIALDDIKSCYPGIVSDIEEFIKDGTIIACRNEEKKDKILFPRKESFLTQLTGTVEVQLNRNFLKTSSNLCNEIRRGDAIFVNRQWFRVSSSTKGGGGGNQPLRAQAPLSVSSEKDMSILNVYIDKFDETRVPLDGTLEIEDDEEEEDTAGGEGREMVAYKHGCTNDIRKLWSETIENMRHLVDDSSVEKELIALGLIPPIEKSSGSSRPAAEGSKDAPKQKRMRVSGANSRKKMLNTHLEGTAYGAILEMEQAKLMAAANNSKK